MRHLAKPLPPQSRLREVLDYDPESGELAWKALPAEAPISDYRNRRAYWNSRFAGKAAAKAGPWRYRTVCVDYQLYRAHRVIWKWMTGNDPVNDIDHIDQDPQNNRWTNLRDVTIQQNMLNCRPSRANKFGLKGVSFDKARGTYVAGYTRNRRRINLGRFQTAEEAHQAYLSALTH